MLIVWFASTLMLTLAPFGPVREPLPFTWLNPATHPLGLFDFYANIALFLPLGVFAARLGFTMRGVVAVGMLFSLFIETMQAYIVVRSPSGWDLVANTMGSVLGVVWSQALLHLSHRVLTRPVRIALLVGGTAFSIYMTKNYGARVRFFYMLPFVYGVLGSMAACSLFRPPHIAAVLCWAGVLMLCGPAVAPLDGLWLLCLTAGVVLGTWPFERSANAPAPSPAPTVG